MDPVVHFEMPYHDAERMAGFYRRSFGWQTRPPGEAMGNYVVATTTASDDHGPKKPGTINGGFFESKPDWPAQHPSLRYVSFTDPEGNRVSLLQPPSRG